MYIDGSAPFKNIYKSFKTTTLENPYVDAPLADCLIAFCLLLWHHNTYPEDAKDCVQAYTLPQDFKRDKGVSPCENLEIRIDRGKWMINDTDRGIFSSVKTGIEENPIAYQLVITNPETSWEHVSDFLLSTLINITLS